MSALVPFPGSILELFTYAMSPFVYLSSIYLYIFSKILYSFYKEKEHEWAAAEWGLWLHWQEVHDCSVHPKFTLPNNWWFHWLFHQAPLQHLIKLLPCNILLSGMYLPKPLMIQVLVPPSITIALFFWWHSSSQVHPPKPLVVSLAVFPSPTPAPDEVDYLQSS